MTSPISQIGYPEYRSNIVKKANLKLVMFIAHQDLVDRTRGPCGDVGVNIEVPRRKGYRWDDRCCIGKGGLGKGSYRSQPNAISCCLTVRTRLHKSRLPLAGWIGRYRNHPQLASAKWAVCTFGLPPNCKGLEYGRAYGPAAPCSLQGGMFTAELLRFSRGKHGLTIHDNFSLRH